MLELAEFVLKLSASKSRLEFSLCFRRSRQRQPDISLAAQELDWGRKLRWRTAEGNDRLLSQDRRMTLPDSAACLIAARGADPRDYVMILDRCSTFAFATPQWRRLRRTELELRWSIHI